MLRRLTTKHTIIVTIISSAFSLLLGEFAVRWLFPNPAFYTGQPGNVPGLVIRHDVRGYTWNPGFRGRMTTAEFSNEYLISTQGLRDEPVVDSDELRILAVGDSFTGGEGVESSQTWPKQFQDKLNSATGLRRTVRVVNAGVSGYSVKQMRQMAEELVPLYSPELVIIGVFPGGSDRIDNPYVLYGEHLVRTRDVPNMRVVEGGFLWYDSAFENGIAARIEVWSQYNCHFAAYLLKAFHKIAGMLNPIWGLADARSEDVELEMEPIFDELALLNEYLKAQQIPLLVLIISWQDSDGTFSTEEKLRARAVRIYCETHDIPNVEPTAYFESIAQGKPVLRFKHDDHWTPIAHSGAAEFIRLHGMPISVDRMSFDKISR